TVSIAQDDDQTVSFTLEKAQASFLQNLTVGILPANVWSEILPQNAALTALNLQPIGSGPYQFEEFAKDKKGSVRSYTLKPFEKYYAETGKIDRLNFKFYSDTASALEALTNKFVEGVNMVPFEHRAETGQNRSVMLESPFLSRESVLFFNQKTNVWLQKKPVREAIALAIDKTFLTHTVLEDQARPITGPLLPGMSGYSAEPGVTPTDLEKSKTILTESGIFKEETTPASTTKKEETDTATEATEETIVRKPNQFTLTTVNNEESLRVADAVKKQLESVGLQIDIVSLPASTLYDKVIAPRDFELLLTTVMYDADLDPSIFWHSSTNTATSLNIVDYKNTEVDKLLESAQVAISDADRETAYKTFQEKLLADIPAVFLYQSTYVYAVAKKIQNVAIESIRIPSDRFANINEWYIKTKKTFR
ncbi:MAG: ABC transporter substrate-binding protein, partial [Patescibacteria group bacterium]